MSLHKFWLLRLVPISSFGKLLNIPTVICDSLIQVMSVLCGIDYWQQDRYGGESVTIERLGLAGLTARKIVEYVTTGKTPS